MLQFYCFVLTMFGIRSFGHFKIFFDNCEVDLGFITAIYLVLKTDCICIFYGLELANLLLGLLKCKSNFRSFLAILFSGFHSRLFIKFVKVLCLIEYVPSEHAQVGPIWIFGGQLAKWA